MSWYSPLNRQDIGDLIGHSTRIFHTLSEYSFYRRTLTNEADVSTRRAIDVPLYNPSRCVIHLCSLPVAMQVDLHHITAKPWECHKIQISKLHQPLFLHCFCVLECWYHSNGRSVVATLEIIIWWGCNARFDWPRASQ